MQRESSLERSLRQVIDVESNFNFRAYSCTPAGVLPDLMFPARSVVTQLRPRPSVSVALKNLFAVLMPTSLLSRSEEGSDLVAYNPHRFVRQFGLDQGLEKSSEAPRRGKSIYSSRQGPPIRELLRSLLGKYGEEGSPIARRRPSLGEMHKAVSGVHSPDSPIPRQVSVLDLI